MTAFKNTLKQAFNALSSAYAGEMLSRKEMQRQLQSPAAVPAATTAATAGVPAVRRKQVALWLTDLPARSVLDYALASCQRMGMDLLILHAGRPRAQELLAAYGEMLENANVAVDIQSLENAVAATLYRHIERTPRIAYLVMGNADTVMKPAGQPFVTPPVPVVVLAESAVAAEQDAGQQAIAA
jgi:hypothetical protein